MSGLTPSGRKFLALMMSPDHICERLNTPAGRSLNMVTVTAGAVLAFSCASASPTRIRSSAEEVLTSVMPSFSSTMAIAVCQSSSTAVWFLKAGSHSDS